ncbi:helix-turn-helix transcriptional regulator [Oceanirhabdus sp. W0125-5]|uniref:helix-turn-helix transcriptional regulator n=1 Tax=Oceanirhabdus sp. W0125-5 TaxID=2999116 RepID=UPI0022F327AA|nr:AraC family transcriptional regulator [Oceanirhabdus sp. W0125-5]WBW95057.1 AraC family transcriptional regulator [Oceanirhabdus sp. W0125-5]
MNIINDIITDFFNCCNLPVMAVDIDFNEMCKVGYNPLLEKNIIKYDIYKDINFDSDDSLSLYLSYENDINFIIVSISRYNKYRGYFVIGPFKCKNDDNNSIPFKPNSCLEYLPSIILNISDSKFSKGMSNLKFNVHVKKAIRHIHENYTHFINLDNLCNDLSVNKSYFCKVFKKETGFTFSSFLNNYRVEKSKYLLEHSDLSLLDIAVSVGFNTQNYYSIVFKKYMDISPLEYRNTISNSNL